jgi:large subunit ribosomal protein L19
MKNEAIDFVEKRQLKTDLAAFRAGDTVRVHTRIKEGDKERVQVFEGVVIRRKKGGNRSTFTVRKVSYGVGVERIFPTHSPRIDRVEIVSAGKVHRARLFYLRDLTGRAARIDREAQGDLGAAEVAVEDAPPSAAATPPAE